MEENPYKAPGPLYNSRSVKPSTAHLPLLYSLAGFVAGTFVAFPIVPVFDPYTQLVYGAMTGGLLGTVVGYLFGRRRNRARTQD